MVTIIINTHTKLLGYFCKHIVAFDGRFRATNSHPENELVSEAVDGTPVMSTDFTKSVRVL